MTVKGKTLHDLTDKRCLVKNKASNPLEDMRERRRGPHRTDVHSLAPNRSKARVKLLLPGKEVKNQSKGVARRVL